MRVALTRRLNLRDFEMINEAEKKKENKLRLTHLYDFVEI